MQTSEDRPAFGGVDTKRDADRFKLYFGPDVSPVCRVGDKLDCVSRGRGIIVNSTPDAPIQWQFRSGSGKPSCILCGDLIRAVKAESGIAVDHQWASAPRPCVPGGRPWMCPG